MKGRAIAYSTDEMAWLDANRLLPIADYHAAFVARFARADVTAVNLHSLRKRKGWRTGRTGQFVKGQEPQNKGQTCAPGTGGRHPNAVATQFRKGNLPHTAKWLGHERVSKDGYVEVSIDETNPHTGFERRYVLKHRWQWEQVNGPVPDGMALKCLDSNKENTDPSNWELIPRALLPLLNGGRHKRRLAFDEASPELKPTILTMAKLTHKARQVRA
jgi:hypothetical protein